MNKNCSNPKCDRKVSNLNLTYCDACQFAYDKGRRARTGSARNSQLNLAHLVEPKDVS